MPTRRRPNLLLLAGAPFAARWTTSCLALNEIAPVRVSGVGAGSAIAGVIIEIANTTDALLAAAALVASAAIVVRARINTLTAKSPV